MAKPVFATNDVPTASQFNSWLVNVNFARKAGTQSVTSSLTLQNDTELFVAVEANAIYFCDVIIQYDGPSAADLKMLLRTPTSGSFVGNATGVATAGTTAFDVVTIGIGGNGSFDFGTLGAGTQVLTISGMLITSGTAGNLQIEWAQNTVNASATRVLSGSHMNLRRVS